MFKFLPVSRLNSWQQLMLLLIIPIALSTIVAVFVEYVLYFNLETTQRATSYTEVIYERELLIKTVVDAETGMRGYVITGDESFLAPFNDALQRFSTIITRLSKLEPDNSQNQSDINEIQKLFRQWLTEVANQQIAARHNAPIGLRLDAQKVYSDFLLILAAHHQYLSSHKATDMAAWHMKVDAAAQDLGAILALRLNPEQAASWQRIDEKLRDYEQHPTANQILALTQKVTTLADDRVAAELQATRIVTSNLGKKLMDSMRDLDAQGIEREQAKSHMEEAKNQHLVLQAEIAGFGGPIITALLTLR